MKVVRDQYVIIQYWVHDGTSINDYYYRKGTSSAWSPWQRLDNFGCNTPEALASLLGAIEFIDIYLKDVNIDTLVVDGVSYYGKNVRMCLTEQGTRTWGGTFPTGLNKSGAEVLTFGKGGYRIQQFFAQDGYASRIDFGSWKPWIVFKP